MKPLDTAVLIKAVFEGNEPPLNACSLPVVDGKKIIKYLFYVYLVPVGENLEKMQENKWKTKKQGSLFPENYCPTVPDHCTERGLRTSLFCSVALSHTFSLQY